MAKHKIKTAAAVYTGGGIYIYYGQLESGLFFRTCDEWEAAYICTQETDTEEADYEEFYEKFAIEEITGDDFKTFWNAMINHILSGGKAMGIWSNYSPAELERRKIK